MNILVTGAGGQLGREMQLTASSVKGARWFFTDVCEGYERLDITDIAQVRAFVLGRKIDVVVNCAAWTNVDAAEDPSAFPLVEHLNADAPANLAAVMAETGGWLIHVSTDYVFGAEPCNVPCDEKRQGAPSGVYGLTKLHGEQRIAASGCRYVILRTAWLYSEFGKNFCRTMLSLTATKPSLKVVFDQVGTPTYALDLARAICTIVQSLDGRDAADTVGIYNFSNEGVCSWYDFAKMIQEYSGQKGCLITPCHSDEFPSPVRRPAYSVLDKSLIKEKFNVAVPYWTDSLKICIGNIQNTK